MGRSAKVGRGGSGGGAAAAAAADGVHAWLSALGDRTVELLLRAVMKISALSTLGARQLSADTAYVNNIPVLVVVQTRDIARYEEILIDYGSEYWEWFKNKVHELRAKAGLPPLRRGLRTRP